MSVRNRTPAHTVYATAPAPELAYEDQAPAPDDPSAYCHLLDERGRALCFADVTGRRVHTTAECERDGHWQCGRCIAIAVELARETRWS